MKVYGYVRVSSRDQNEDRQLLAMESFGVDEIVVEKQSGRDFERPLYRHLIRRLKAGDVIVLKSLDRLGRNYQEILDQWALITRNKQASIVVLDMPLLNTETERDLTGRLISDIVLQLLSYVAEIERVFIRQRQAEGIAAAREKGVRFGAPSKKTDDFYIVMQQYREGECSAAAAARKPASMQAPSAAG